MIRFDYYFRGEVKTKRVTIESVISDIQNCKYIKQVEELRESIAYHVANGKTESVGTMSKLPAMYWAEGKNGYTGLVVLTLMVGENTGKLEELREMVKGLQQVMCAFKGSSGRALKVVIPYCVKDGNMPTDRAEIEVFHATAHQKASAFLLQMTGVKAEAKDVAPAQGVRMTADADVFYNPDALAIPLKKPERLPDTIVSDVECLTEHERNRLPGYSDLEMEVTKFNFVCRRMGFDAGNPLPESLLSLATECRRRGIEEEVAVKCVMSLCNNHDKEMLIRTSFQNAYAGKKLGNSYSMPLTLFNLQLLQHYLSTRYLFRRNTITDSLEYNERGKHLLSWRPLTAHTQNSICLNAMKAGIEIWDKDLTRYLQSDFVADYDPIVEWINDLPKWDGKDRLAELSASVKTTNPQWDSDLRVWLRSMVSQWTNRRCLHGSSIVLMLIGGQGTGKSTFCKRLMPEELSAYYNDRIDFTNKREAERALMRFCLICMDEFDQITPSQTASLKHIIQKSDVKWRKMYQDDIEQRHRYAAFCATTNSLTPLTDPTGSRRYLCTEVLDRIDTSFPIDHKQLYAQIVSEIRSGLPTYFSVDDELRIQQMNKMYYKEQPLETIMNTMVKAADENEEGEWLTSLDVVERIRKRFRGIKADASTMDKISKILVSRNIQRKRTARKRLFYVIMPSQE